MEADALSNILWDRRIMKLWTVALLKAVLAGCCCNVALYEHYMGYSPISHAMQFTSPDASVWVINHKASLPTNCQITNTQWIKEQNQDPVLAEIFHLCKEGKLYK